MASMKDVRKALISLMGAKKANIGTGREPAYVPGDEFGPPSTGDNLAQARRHAREVQGADPLAQPVDMEDFYNTQLHRDSYNSINDPWLENIEPDPTYFRRTEGVGDPARLPDSEARRSQKMDQAEMMQAMDDEFIDLQKQFERLAGRPPSAEEMADIGTLENLVDLLEEASGGGKPVVRPTIADDIDEIPF